MIDLIHSPHAAYSASTAGRTAVSPSGAGQMADASPRSVVSWREMLSGKQGDFVVADGPEDLAVMQEWAADYLERNPGLSFDDYEPLPDPASVLAVEDWKALAQKYSPASMTQEAYDRFLDELCQLGVLSASYLADLGHSSHIGMTKITAETLRPTLANAAEQPPFHVPTFQDGASRVNLFYWAQEEKAWKYFDEGKNQWLPTHKAAAFQQLYDIFQGMALFG